MLTVITFQIVPAIDITTPLIATAQICGNIPGIKSDSPKITYAVISATVEPKRLLTDSPTRPPKIEPIEIAASNMPKPRAPRPSSSRTNFTNTAWANMPHILAMPSMIASVRNKSCFQSQIKPCFSSLENGAFVCSIIAVFLTLIERIKIAAITSATAFTAKGALIAITNIHAPSGKPIKPLLMICEIYKRLFASSNDSSSTIAGNIACELISKNSSQTPATALAAINR